MESTWWELFWKACFLVLVVFLFFWRIYITCFCSVNTGVDGEYHGYIPENTPNVELRWSE